MTTRFFWIVYGLLFMAAGCRAETVEQVERARTFEAGRAAYAYAGSVVIEPVAVAWPKLRNLRRSNFKGTMVYLHGCDGINALSLQAADIFASAGYLVLMPDSFARLDKPVSCRPAAFQGSLHRDVLAWRQGEAEEAVRRAKT